jgi:hypothetical protein
MLVTRRLVHGRIAFSAPGLPLEGYSPSSLCSIATRSTTLRRKQAAMSAMTVLWALQKLRRPISVALRKVEHQHLLQTVTNGAALKSGKLLKQQLWLEVHCAKALDHHEAEHRWTLLIAGPVSVTNTTIDLDAHMDSRKE